MQGIVQSCYDDGTKRQTSTRHGQDGPETREELFTYHFRKALAHARTYDRLERPRLLDMLAVTLQHLFWIHMDQPEIPFLPTDDEYGNTVKNTSGESVLELREFSLDGNNPNSLYPVAEMYLGMQQAAAGNHHGRPITSRKVGRNEPCPCGSGLKYKKCCGR